jgi:hypothetical protein
MTVRVRIELLEAKCGDTEDKTGADELYVIGAGFAGQNTVKPVLTTPFNINDGETKSFNPAERIIFDADIEDNSTVLCGVVAYDEDFGKDWAKRPAWLDTLAKEVLTKAIDAASHGQVKPAAILGGIGVAYGIFGWFAASDADDELGRLELTIPASGPVLEEREWPFSRDGGFFDYSGWNYSIKYRITRAFPVPQEYKIVNKNSGQCLDVPDASTADRVPIQQFTCHGGDNQRWLIEHVLGQEYRIRNKNSKKCLDVAGASTDARAKVQQFTCHGGDNQRWNLIL